MTDASKDAATSTAASSEHTPEHAPGKANTNARSVFGAVFAQWKLWLPAVGGLSLLLHFWRIGYAPTLSFSDLGTVLGAMLLFGVVVLLMVLLLLIVPTILIAYWVDSHFLVPPPKKRSNVEPEKRKGLRSVRPAAEVESSSPQIDWFAHGSMSWFFMAALWPLILYIGLVYFLSMQTILPTKAQSFVVLAPFTIGLLGVFSVTIFIDAAWVRQRLRLFRRSWIQFTSISFLYLTIWAALYVLLIKLGVRLEGWKLFYVGMSLFWIPMLHFTMYRTHRGKTEVPRPVIAIMPIMMFLIYSVLPLAIVDRALDTFGLGMMPNVDLVLTARGCEIVHAAWPERICSPDHREKAETYRLDNIEVLTRIGTHYYIGAPGAMAAMDDNTLPRFPIPADEVLSWRRNPPTKDTEKTASK